MDLPGRILGPLVRRVDHGDVVVAGWQSTDAELAAIVALGAADRYQDPQAALEQSMMRRRSQSLVLRGSKV